MKNQRRSLRQALCAQMFSWNYFLKNPRRVFRIETLPNNLREIGTYATSKQPWSSRRGRLSA
jgi:hypothetical protein